MKDITYQVVLTLLGLFCVGLSTIFVAHIVSFILFIAIGVVCFGLVILMAGWKIPKESDDE